MSLVSSFDKSGKNHGWPIMRVLGIAELFAAKRDIHLSNAKVWFLLAQVRGLAINLFSLCETSYGCEHSGSVNSTLTIPKLKTSFFRSLKTTYVKEFWPTIWGCSHTSSCFLVAIYRNMSTGSLCQRDLIVIKSCLTEVTYLNSVIVFFLLSEKNISSLEIHVIDVFAMQVRKPWKSHEMNDSSVFEGGPVVGQFTFTTSDFHVRVTWQKT